MSSRRRWKCEQSLPRPTLKDVRRSLRKLIEMVAFSYGEIDNVIREPKALMMIACLRRALALLPKK